MRKLLMTLGLIIIALNSMAQTWSLSGVVLNKSNGQPVEYATIVLESTSQWAVADGDGKSHIPYRNSKLTRIL